MDVTNLTASSDIYLHQVSTLSPVWTCSPLSIDAAEVRDNERTHLLVNELAVTRTQVTSNHTIGDIAKSQPRVSGATSIVDVLS